MGRSRERAIERIRTLLQMAGFFTADTHGVRPTSFDLVARRDSLLLLVKVQKNIDAVDVGEANRLRELGVLFPGTPLLIGEVSGNTPLEAGVVYNRYGVPIIVEETLRDYLEEGLPPFLFSSPGGIFARIDGGLLRRLREDRDLSLGALANAAGVSRRTIQLYEEGTGAEVSVVQRIELFLGEPIAVPIELFAVSKLPVRPDAEKKEGSADDRSAEIQRTPHRKPRLTGDPLRDGVFRQLEGMGWQVVVTLRCPFDAFSLEPNAAEREIMLTGVGTLRSAQHRAEVLHQVARVAEGHAFFVVTESPHRTSIDGLPIVTMRELKRHRDPEELLDLLGERESM